MCRKFLCMIPSLRCMFVCHNILPMAISIICGLSIISTDDTQLMSGAASTMNESTASGQQDWSAVWECFESPHRLLSVPAGGLSKSMQVLKNFTLLNEKIIIKPIKKKKHKLWYSPFWS